MSALFFQLQLAILLLVVTLNLVGALCTLLLTKGLIWEGSQDPSQDDPNESGIPNLIIFLLAGQSETRSGRGAEEVVKKDKVGKTLLIAGTRTS